MIAIFSTNNSFSDENSVIRNTGSIFGTLLVTSANASFSLFYFLTEQEFPPCSKTGIPPFRHVYVRRPSSSHGLKVQALECSLPKA